MNLCTVTQPPTPERECLAVVYSLGKSCASCAVDCYRRGLDAKAVKADNKKLVRHVEGR